MDYLQSYLLPSSPRPCRVCLVSKPELLQHNPLLSRLPSNSTSSYRSRNSSYSSSHS